MTDIFSFTLLKTDGAARRGEIVTPHGRVQTPAFMPVGTQGTVKGLTPDIVRGTGAEIVLGNTYHLMLRPGAERIAALGGLHSFMQWPLPILTDSGGFQVMSLSSLRKLDERGVTFRSHLDGAMVALSPERAIEIQALLGADIAMQLDECLRLPAALDEIKRAMELSLRWAERSKRAFETRAREGYALFGIVQGGDVMALRETSARALNGNRFPRLRHRRAGGRRAARRDAQDRGRNGAHAAGGASALSDGRRHAARSPGSRGARHRHVRLRAADAQRPPRHGLYPLRPDQPRQCPPCRRPAPARRTKHACGGAHLFARLSAPPHQGQRDAGGSAAVHRQSRLLPGTDGRHARGHRRR